MNIWMLCKGEEAIQPLNCDPWRVVEAQHVLSSRDLVDTTEEHDLLELLLEESKPSINQNKHYLIFTPFRYPPLKYGSRFGQTFEPSLWYGSLQIEAAFSEVAYYQLKFQNDTEAELGYVETVLTAFNAFTKTSKGIDLTQEPFERYISKISSKETYQWSQLLGTSMREEGIEICLYFSARAQNRVKNAAVFTSEVFYSKNNQYIHEQQSWQSFANKNVVEFTRLGVTGKERLIFEKNYFA